MPNFPGLAALNAGPERRCLELWPEIAHRTLPGSVADVRAVEHHRRKVRFFPTTFLVNALEQEKGKPRARARARPDISPKA